MGNIEVFGKLPSHYRRKRSGVNSHYNRQLNSSDLTLTFASLCIIDLLGVFPIVTLPSALILCGYYGIPLLLFVLTMQVYTAVILGRCWVIAQDLDPAILTKKRYPYAALADLAYGKYLKMFVTILIDLTVFGGSIPNLLVASQNLQLLGHRVSSGNFYFSFCYWLILIGIFMCPIMWLGSPKNMKILACVSVFTVLFATTLIWYCILADTKHNFNPDLNENTNSSQFPTYENLLVAYGLIAFQFDVHPMLLTIQVDMQEKEKISQAVCLGISTTCVLSIITTIFAAFRYGFNVTANLFEVLPRSNMLYIALLLVTLQLCLSSAVGNSALFQHIEDILHVPRKFSIKRCIVRSLFVWMAVLFGELIPQFDLLMGVLGGTLIGPLIFILPPMIYTKIIRLEKLKHEEETRKLFELYDDSSYESVSTSDYGTFNSSNNFNNAVQSISFKIPKQLCTILHSDCTLSIAVIIFGLFATFVSTYYNIVKLSNFSELWSPCINNITDSFITLLNDMVQINEL